MTEEHPFAQYVRIIGKGPHLSRPLTEEEMADAARMIMSGRVEPVQLGAFLCLLRVRTEEPEEGAGFTRAVREFFDVPADKPPVDLDWPTYAGKARQLPWFILSALLLAKGGVRVLMHGTEGHTAGRIYAREALEFLGVPVAGSLKEAADHIRRHNFGFVSLRDFSPRLQEIMDLKPILGLRSPVNTFARMLNPMGAPYQVHGTFHPAYRDIHRESARLLGQPHMAVFKGDGGEVERRPTKPVEVMALHGGEAVEEEWSAILPEDTEAPEGGLDPARLAALWRGDFSDAYAEATVYGTAAIVLRVMGKADSPAAALVAAKRLWEGRDRGRIVG
ncbi:MAG: glycosyl transferase family protein [Magnetospirillum sp. WYHS-4]